MIVQEFGPKTIRPSSLTTASDCMRRYAAHHLADEVAAAGYVLGHSRPTHIGAAIGSGVHAAAAYTMGEKRAHDTLGSAEEAIDRAQAEFDLRTEYGVTWDRVTDDLSTARRQIQRMAKVYRKHLAPNLTPVLVEDRLEADVGDGWTVSGQIDAMTGDPDHTLQDLKTGAAARANAVQYGMYQMLVRAHGYQLTGVEEKFVRRVRLDKEQPIPDTVPIDLIASRADAWELVGEIKRAAAEFERRVADPNGAAPPQAFRANPASVLCSPRFCRAWGTEFCKAHRR